MANCVCEVYGTLADFHTAVELVDDTKLLSCFPTKDDGNLTKYVIVKKT